MSQDSASGQDRGKVYWKHNVQACVVFGMGRSKKLRDEICTKSRISKMMNVPFMLCNVRFNRLSKSATQNRRGVKDDQKRRPRNTPFRIPVSLLCPVLCPFPLHSYFLSTTVQFRACEDIDPTEASSRSGSTIACLTLQAFHC